jgi:hypothetical protein
MRRVGALWRALALGTSAFLLGGCASVPSGPDVTALPGPGKSFEQFQADDAVCRQWASERSGTTPQQAAGSSTAESAGVGTLIGAGIGALFGAATGHPAAGVAIGAGGGLLAGTAAGAGTGHAAAYEVQRRYDNAYEQCMYAKGNQLPTAPPAPARAFFAAPPPPPPAPPGAGAPPGALVPLPGAPTPEWTE